MSVSCSVGGQPRDWTPKVNLVRYVDDFIITGGSEELLENVWLRLVYAGETKIRRHVKIRKNANPFDPQWRDYLAERAFQKKFGITRRVAGIKTS